MKIPLFIILLIIILKKCKVIENFISFEKKKWNNPDIKNSHNCLSYALDDIELKRKNQRKLFVKKRNGKFKCKNLKDSLLNLNSNYYEINKNNKCKNHFYKIAYLVDKNNKYFHFLRKDTEENSWSHKNHFNKITNLDSDGNKIINPEENKFKYKIKNNKFVNYNNFCGYLCIPENYYIN